MKYQLRKCEKFTIWRATQVIELDPEDFRKYEESPYEGNSEKEFLNYINQFMGDAPYEEIFYPLIELNDNPDWEEYSCSADKYEDSWLEIGEANENYTKTGGFDSHYDTLDS